MNIIVRYTLNYALYMLAFTLIIHNIGKDSDIMITFWISSGMTATPHFLFAAMTKLHHAATATATATTTATNLHQNSTSVSPKEVSISPPVHDRDSGLCVEQSVAELETTSLTCTSSSSPGHDDSVPIEILSPNCRLITNDCFSNSNSHIGGTNNAYINSVKRRRKPDGNFFFLFFHFHF